MIATRFGFRMAEVRVPGKNGALDKILPAEPVTPEDYLVTPQQDNYHQLFEIPISEQFIRRFQQTRRNHEAQPGILAVHLLKKFFETQKSGILGYRQFIDQCLLATNQQWNKDLGDSRASGVGHIDFNGFSQAEKNIDPQTGPKYLAIHRSIEKELKQLAAMVECSQDEQETLYQRMIQDAIVIAENSPSVKMPHFDTGTTGTVFYQERENVKPGTGLHAFYDISQFSKDFGIPLHELLVPLQYRSIPLKQSPNGAFVAITVRDNYEKDGWKVNHIHQILKDSYCLKIDPPDGSDDLTVFFWNEFIPRSAQLNVEHLKENDRRFPLFPIFHGATPPQAENPDKASMRQLITSFVFNKNSEVS